jgi:putative YpdA family bacillithiol system oxidoreductase
MSAGCHVTIHEKLQAVAGANRPKLEKPVPVAAAFAAHFEDFSAKPDDAMHKKHFEAFGNADCKSCHDSDAPEPLDPKKPKPAADLAKARHDMRLKCLGCHGFGPQATLRARCYSCHFEHNTDPSSFLAAVPLVAASADRAGLSGYGPGMLLLLATVGAVPVLYFGVMIAGYRLEHWSFSGKVLAFLRERKIVQPPPAPPKPARELQVSAAPKTGETKPPENSTPGGNKRPRIDLDLCVGCGTCVHVCPFNVLEIVNEKAIAARLDDCTGYAACAAECPTEAITLVDGGPMQTVELPVYGPSLETNVPGLFLAGEVTGKALIKVAINQGKTVVESIMKDRPMPSDGYDVIVVGAGPGGVSTGLAAEIEGLKALVLEQGTVANTVRNYPRQKFIMAEPVMIPVYGPLHMEDSSKETLLEKWEEIIQTTGLKIQQEERVLKVVKAADRFLVTTTKGEYKGARVVIAIGRRGTPRKLRVPGEDSAKVTYNLSDAEAYRGKAICVVGAGDSGIEAANGLARASLQNRVWLVNRTDNVSRAKPRNQKKLQKALDEGRITMFINAAVTEIGGNTVTVKTSESVEVVENDFVFVMVGGESPKDFLTQCGIEFSQRPLG